jgi:hypothetical protein
MGSGESARLPTQFCETYYRTLDRRGRSTAAVANAHRWTTQYNGLLSCNRLIAALRG